MQGGGLPGRRARTPGEMAERAAARVLLALPPAVKRRLAGAPIRDGELAMDLDTQLLLTLANRDPDPPLQAQELGHARANLARSVRLVAGRDPAVAEVRELTVAGAAGPLRARLYVPAEAAAEQPGALLVYYHGGGWVLGDLDTHDQPCRLLARSSGARVLSVDYRLAPEHRFPAPVEDAFAAFGDAVARAGELGADPARVGVGGDSAGGHLAAVVALLCARAGEGPAPAVQLLIYPATDLAEVHDSRLRFAEGFLLTKENMDWYEDQFLGPADRHDPRVSPLLAGDLSGLAPAFVVTAGFDPLRDEGEAYAAALADAGVPVIRRRHDGFIHGFTHMLLGPPGARDAVAEMGGVLRAALAP
jgi:acetyl esterase/lipase